MKKNLNLIGKKSRKAFETKINEKKKNKVLNYYADLIRKNERLILFQNEKDVNYAKKNKRVFVWSSRVQKSVSIVYLL